VAEIIGSLRTTDIVGRLGGDEFAIFFPATDQVSVKTIMEKVVGQLAKLADENSWPISFSAGVVTCRGGVYDLNAIISSADFLMYQVKKAGKNSIRYAEYPLTDSVNFP
jgi:diguanylate cyclase (GGDEF)-like protein